MLKRSRITGTLDVQRLGEALARPGMDTRVWCSLAAVKNFYFDPDHGPFCDVILMPSGVEETVRVGSIYAGPGFGFYVPLEPNDEVLVAFPEGDPDHGGVIVSRAWSASDPPPSEANNNQSDLLLHVQKDKTLRIATEGSGNVVLKVDSGKVLLGDESGTSPVARKDDKVNLGTWQVTVGGGGAITAITVTPPFVGAPVTLNAATPGPFEIDGNIKEGSSKVESA